VPTAIRQLIAVVNLPAFVESQMFDVLAANPRATALSPSMRAGENRLRSMFLDPAERDLHPDWPRAIGTMIASFRASIGPEADDPRIAQLVGELSLASEPFRRLWARHDVRALTGGAVTMSHPELGPLELWREKLPIGDSGGQLLVLYHAAPGSESAAALERLAATATSLSGPGSAVAGTGARSREPRTRG
jgi:hypothetical protein